MAGEFGWSNWPTIQRDALRAALVHIRSKQQLVVSQPFFQIDHPVPGCDVYWADDMHYRREETFQADIFFNQGYGPDRRRIRFARDTGRAGLIATWFWDNHHLVSDTVQAAVLSDVYFYAHGFRSAYIRNGFSLEGGFAPLCPVFWRMQDVEEAATRAILGPRSDVLYGGYNSYVEFPDRDVFIERIKHHIPDNNLFVTQHGTPAEQHPFYGMSPVDRMLEWMRYKVSLCISFGGNTAIRIFDMLLGGGIPLIVGRPHDLDAIIPRHMQESLPVVVVDEETPEAIDAAFRTCLARFDEGGLDGVMTRYAYTRNNHMPHHRLAHMVDRIRTLAEQADDLDALFGDNA